jgi:hypothetical protein
VSRIDDFLNKQGKPIRIALRFYVVWLVIGGLLTLTMSAISAAPQMNKYTNTIVLSFIVGFLGIVLAIVSRHKERRLLGVKISPWVADFCQGMSTEMFGAIVIGLFIMFIVERSLS